MNLTLPPHDLRQQPGMEVGTTVNKHQSGRGWDLVRGQVGVSISRPPQSGPGEVALGGEGLRAVFPQDDLIRGGPPPHLGDITRAARSCSL